MIQRGNDGNQITYVIPKHQSINSSRSKLFLKLTYNDLSASMLLPAIKLKRESTLSYTLKHIKAQVVNRTFDIRRKKNEQIFSGVTTVALSPTCLPRIWNCKLASLCKQSRTKTKISILSSIKLETSDWLIIVHQAAS